MLASASLFPGRVALRWCTVCSLYIENIFEWPQEVLLSLSASFFGSIGPIQSEHMCHHLINGLTSASTGWKNLSL